jgi:hypothetical protein
VRQQLGDEPVGMRRQTGQHVLEVDPRIMPMHPPDCARLMTVAARWPASSLPAKSHALRPIAQGRIRFSRWLLWQLNSPRSQCDGTLEGDHLAL